jgi:hypothetical protein
MVHCRTFRQAASHVGKLLRMLAAVSYHDPELAAQFFEMGPIRGRRETALCLKRQMVLGSLRAADPLKAADDFLDLVAGGQLMTGIILGCLDTMHHKSSSPKHAVDVFLKVYGQNAKNVAF